MLDQKIGMTLSKKRLKKHVSLSETTIEAVQEFANSEGVSFSRAIEILSLSSLSGKEQAMGLAAYLGDAVRREANQHYNRFAKLIVHAGLEAGTAKEMSRAAYSMGMFDRFMVARRAGLKEGDYLGFMKKFLLSENDDNVLKKVADKRAEKARYQAVKQLKKPIAEMHEIMEEIEKSALKYEAEDTLDRESLVI